MRGESFSNTKTKIIIRSIDKNEEAKRKIAEVPKIAPSILRCFSNSFTSILSIPSFVITAKKLTIVAPKSSTPKLAGPRYLEVRIVRIKLTKA